MPKEKYDPPDPRRMYTIMSSEEAANGKKSYWAELEISGQCCYYTLCLVLLCGYCFVLWPRLANTFHCCWSPTTLWSCCCANWPIFRQTLLCAIIFQPSVVGFFFFGFFCIQLGVITRKQFTFPTSLLLHFLDSVFLCPCFTSTHIRLYYGLFVYLYI